MPKFRKKPVVIEAIKWDSKNGIEGGTPQWIKAGMEDYSIMRVGNEVRINTLEGTMTASDGDYIIQGVNGEIYPCKPDIFDKTYEKVED